MKFTLKEILNLSLDIGERLLKCGGEVSRVENTIERIIKGYGVEYCEVTVLNAVIIVTIRSQNRTYTESRRIKYRKIDLYQFEMLNDLSRRICNNNISRKEILNYIDEYKKYKNSIFICFGMILGASSFTMFFNGNFYDAFSAGCIAFILYVLNYLTNIKHSNLLIYNFFSSFLIGIVAHLFISLGIGYNIDKIIIGDIMLLIPGLSIFISIDDIFKGDTFSGISRLTDDIFSALVIAAGIGLSLLLGGMIG